jgi:hypothetical protein
MGERDRSESAGVVMTAPNVDCDVWIGGEPYDELDDIKALRHVPCGAVIHGDDSRIDHVCPPPCPECGERGEDVVVEISVRAGERFIEWRCCGQDVRCEHDRLLAQCTRFHGEP